MQVVTPFPLTDTAIIAGLILLNGIFSMAELAIVSARRSRLALLAKKGSKAATAALSLATQPGRFLSTVQIGITLIGIIAGAYSGASLGGPVGERLAMAGVPDAIAMQAGFMLVIAITTYFSLVIGELVPKQLALYAAEPIAMIAARPMQWLAIIMAPLVWLLDRSSYFVISALRLRPKGEPGLTAEELHMVFTEATRTGLLEESERMLMTGIMRIAERPVREHMTPRTELEWINYHADKEEILERVTQSNHSLLPVGDGSPDHIIGIIKVRDALARQITGQPAEIADMVRKVEIIPDQVDTLDALKIMQHADVAMALVHDEYGHFEGIVTPADLLSAIAGHFTSYQDEDDKPPIILREDGSMLVSGDCPMDTLADQLGLELANDRDYATAAGLVLSILKQIPDEGEHFTEQGWRFEVVDMDGRRIDKLLITVQDEQPSS